MSNEKNLKPFKKGYDPRRNLRGVPKDTLRGRALVRKVGSELVTLKRRLEDGQTAEFEVTRAENMVREMYESKATADRVILLKCLWPGIVDKDDVAASDERIEVRLVSDPPLVFDYAKFINSATKPIESSDST